MINNIIFENFSLMTIMKWYWNKYKQKKMEINNFYSYLYSQNI